MTSLDNFRARYRAKKGGKAHNAGTARNRSALAIRTKADARARQFIERWLEGETHQEIADSLGVTGSSVTGSIAGYRKRHPDCPIPAGPKKRGPAINTTADTND